MTNIMCTPVRTSTRASLLPRIFRRLLSATLLALGIAANASAQWVTTPEQMYFPASHNWVFRRTYPAADRLFNAFDYGHAVLYETLWRAPNADSSRLEVREFDFLTKQLLVRPPRLPLEERAIEPLYARLAPEAKAMFDWAHLLHRQVYDVLADETLSQVQRDAQIATLQRYYLTRRDLAFSTRPKTMALMQEQPYSLAFRQRYPKFNGLIWAYHWMQVGLYEPLLTGRTLAERQTGVAATIARFRQLIADAPNSMPYVMPMTSAISPHFAARYPEIAIIFDNLHSMHDVISDILANPNVPRDRKRAEILLAGARYRDDTTEVMTVAEWREMSEMMGVENMGGRASDVMLPLPTPRVARGAVMRHNARGAHADEHAGHDMTAMANQDTANHHGGVAAPNDSVSALATVRSFYNALARGDSASALALFAVDASVVVNGARQSVAEYRSQTLAGDIAATSHSQLLLSPQSVIVQGDSASIAQTVRTTPPESHAAAPNAPNEHPVSRIEHVSLVRRGTTWLIAVIDRSADAPPHVHEH